MEALLYQKLDDNKVKCNLCNHRCIIKEGKRGKCKVRENRSGTLETLVYKRLIATHIDPVEKKPVYHLYPGSLSYSVATVGCNFKCRFCQNSDIAQELPKQVSVDVDGMVAGGFFTPEAIVMDAKKSNCKSIAYTYSEPTIYFEFAYNTAKLAKENNIKNVFVTNGYMTPEAIHMIAPYLDAANVDLKAFNDSFYEELCGGRLEHVKESITLLKSMGILVEITTLLIPGLNDDKEELKNLATFIAECVGAETPWHISRFHPTYKLTDRPPTPLKTLDTAREIGLEAGLKYVYTGNVPGEGGENTHCHNCGKLLIKRWGFTVVENHVSNNRCPSCDTEVYGIGMG